MNCGLHKTLCICAVIPRLNLRTKVSLIIHRKELKRTTNTGRLALQALVNSTVRIRGEHQAQALDLTDLLSNDYRSVLFFPSADAQELSAEFLNQSPLPVQLIVPDGNWRQASKVGIRHPELAHLERVKIGAPNQGTNHLRAEHFAEGMSTLQAIAMAITVIEGEAAGNELLNVYQAKLRNTLIGRGQKPTT